MNRENNRLLLPEYGRNVQKMVDYLKSIEDREQRNRQAEVVVAIMGNVNPAQRDNEGFRQMLWDHLFVIADFDLDVDSPYSRPTAAMFTPVPQRVPYNQAYVSQKHYGTLVRRMAQTLAGSEAGEERDMVAANVAKFMKQKSFEYNREYPSNEVVIADIQAMSDGAICLEPDTLDKTKLDFTTVNRNNNNNGNNGKKKNFQKKYKKNKQ